MKSTIDPVHLCAHCKVDIGLDVDGSRSARGHVGPQASACRRHQKRRNIRFQSHSAAVCNLALCKSSRVMLSNQRGMLQLSLALSVSLARSLARSLSLSGATATSGRAARAQHPHERGDE